MASALEVRKIIRKYLAGDIELQSFAEAFEDQYSALIVAKDMESLILGDRVQALLGRVSSKFANESDLKNWLLPLSVEPVNQVINIQCAWAPTVNHYLGEGTYPEPRFSGTSPGMVFGSPVVLGR